MVEDSRHDEREVGRRAAVWGALVAGGLVLVVAGVLVGNWWPRRTVERGGPGEVGPLDSARLMELREQLRQEPGNEELAAEARRLDERLRNEYFERIELARRGAWVLLGGAVVLVAGLKVAEELKRKTEGRMPSAREEKTEGRMPSARGSAGRMPSGREDAAGQLRRYRRLRWGVGAMAGAMVLVGVGVVWFGGVGRFESRARTGGPSSGPSGHLLPGGEGQLRRDVRHASAEEMAANWASWRGPGGSGVSAYEDVPVAWDGVSGAGVAWQAEVPLAGHNSPIVWEGRVFLSGATAQRREVYCWDAGTGEMLWQREVTGIARRPGEVESSEWTGYAAPTMATDGARVYAIFANGDIAGFSMEGEQLWGRNMGPMDELYGYASSLATWGGLVLVQSDRGDVEEGLARGYGLDGATGATVWEAERPVGGSWTSPIVAGIGPGGVEQVVMAGNPLVIGHDPGTGEELWRAACMGADAAPSPVWAGGFVLAAQPWMELSAIRVDGGEADVAWKGMDGVPDICSPVSDGELAYTLTTDGVVTCYRVADGEKLWEESLAGGEYLASPGLAGGRLYCLSKEGAMYVGRVSAAGYEELAVNELGEGGTTASPAFAAGRIYLRSEGHLWAIGEREE